VRKTRSSLIFLCALDSVSFIYLSISPNPSSSTNQTPDHTDKQLAAQRKENEEGAAALTPTEATVLATKWRDARTALPGDLI
jgi:hypothetical protein